MKVIIERFAILETVPKHCEIYLDERSTIRQLIYKLTFNYGCKVSDDLIKEEGLSDYVVILINGKSISLLNGLETELMDGDHIFITLIISGG